MTLFESPLDKQFNTIDWKEQTIQFEYKCKAPKIFGEGVFRFNAPITFWAIASKRGWIVIKKSRNYVLLKPPIPPTKKSFEISIKIPTQEQIIRIAEELQTKQKSVAGLLGEWPFFFIYEHKVAASSPEKNLLTGKTIFKEISSWTSSSYLVIGEHNIWRKTADFIDGSFVINEY